MATNPSQRICLITGSRGYLGSCVKRAFTHAGWKVVELTRNPTTEETREGKAIEYRLGSTKELEKLRGADALVHCAYDFSLRDWASIVAANVEGAEKLFAAAKSAGVGRRIFVSSISAYEGCKSLYGKAKLEAEKRLRANGALLLRPGLIYGEEPGGIFGNLVERVTISNTLPVFGGGKQVLYMTHEADLCRVMTDYAGGRFESPDGPVTVANERGWTFRAILEELARAQGKQLHLVSIQWRPLWLLLKCCEMLGLRLKFRSDSLLSLMHQNLNPSFELTKRLGLKFRGFDAKSLRFARRG